MVYLLGCGQGNGLRRAFDRTHNFLKVFGLDNPAREDAADGAVGDARGDTYVAKPQSSLKHLDAQIGQRPWCYLKRAHVAWLQRNETFAIKMLIDSEID